MRIQVQPSVVYGSLISLLLAWGAGARAEEPTAKTGDEQIEAYLKQETAKLSQRVLDGAKSREEWEARRPRLRQEYFDMLGRTIRTEGKDQGTSWSLVDVNGAQCYGQDAKGIAARHIYDALRRVTEVQKTENGTTTTTERTISLPTPGLGASVSDGMTGV